MSEKGDEMKMWEIKKTKRIRSSGLLKLDGLVRRVRKTKTISLIAALILCLAILTVCAQADGIIVLSQNASLGSATDVQTFNFKLDKAAAVTVTLKHPEQGKSAPVWELGLFDSTDAQMMTIQSGQTGSSNSDINYLGAGNYTIRVKCLYSMYYSADTFTVEVTAVENVGQFEIEGNDSKDAATDIDLNKDVTGSLFVKTDTDNYRLTIAEDGKLDVTFTHPNVESGGQFWQITLFDPTDAILLDIYSTGDGTVTSAIPSYIAKGEYLLRVKAPYPFLYHSGASYRIGTKFTKNEGFFEVENNSTKAVASPMPAVNSTVTGNLYINSDVDHFGFTVVEGGSASFKFTHPNTEKSGDYWAITLFDAADAQLISANIKGTETVFNSAAFDLDTGEYIIRVHAPHPSLYFSAVDYALSVVSEEVVFSGGKTMTDAGSESKPDAGAVGTPVSEGADTPSGWAVDTVMLAISAQLVPESLQNKYKTSITRLEFCQMIVRYIEKQSAGPIEAFLEARSLLIDEQVFADTKDADVLAANALEIVNGMGDGTFSPSGDITREQAAAMLTRLQKVMGEAVTGMDNAGFSDGGSISPWALESVNYVFSQGIMTGVGGNLFDPEGSYSREQSILTLFRIFSK